VGSNVVLAGLEVYNERAIDAPSRKRQSPSRMRRGL
jgi:hypothetical protein